MKTENARRLRTAGTTDEATTNRQLRCDGGRDRVPVCPHCESVSVREKQSDPRNASRTSTDDWYCHKCNAHFQTPDRKPRSETDARPDNPGSSDLVKRLLDADADEVGRPMTDGGEDRVLVVRGAGKFNHKTYHTDADCYQLQRSDCEPVEKPLHVLNDSYAECRWCSGEADTSHPDEYDPNEFVRILADADPEDVGRPMTDGGSEEITVCPNCDSARIVRRTRSNLRQRWRCKDCEARFDEADRREPRSHNVSTHGPGRALQQADPDDWPPSDDVDRGEGVETDGGHDRRLSVEDLTDEQIEAVLNTRGFRKMLAYQKLAEGVSVLADRDEIYESLVTSITNQHGSVRSEESVREVLDLFRKEVETFTEPLVDDDSGADAVDLEDLYVDDRDDEDGELRTDGGHTGAQPTGVAVVESWAHRTVGVGTVHSLPDTARTSTFDIGRLQSLLEVADQMGWSSVDLHVDDDFPLVVTQNGSDADSALLVSPRIAPGADAGGDA
jgi:transposase-like protein